MRYTLAWYVVTIGPYLMLSYGATLLWNRHSRVPALMVGVGFFTAALSQMAAAYASFALSAAAPSAAGIARLMPKFEHWQWLTHGLGPVGVWMAAAGLLAHGVRLPPSGDR